MQCKVPWLPGRPCLAIYVRCCCLSVSDSVTCRCCQAKTVRRQNCNVTCPRKWPENSHSSVYLSTLTAVLISPLFSSDFNFITQIQRTCRLTVLWQTGNKRSKIPTVFGDHLACLRFVPSLDLRSSASVS
jgi:hypothetical protein